MIPLVPCPSIDGKAIRARQTCFCGLFRSLTNASRPARSVGVTLTMIPVRIAQTRTAHLSPEAPDGLFRQVGSTSARPESGFHFNAEYIRWAPLTTRNTANNPARMREGSQCATATPRRTVTRVPATSAASAGKLM
jgi:hypothetical protein